MNSQSSRPHASTNKTFRKRAPLEPIPEGWRRYVLLGVFALSIAGVIATLSAVYALRWLLPYLR